MMNPIKLLVISLCISVSSKGFSQKSVIKGIVTDEKTHQVVANTKLTLILDSTITKELITDIDGFFILSGIPTGKHEIKIIAENYREKKVKNIHVYESTTCYLKVKLLSK